mmetsp:Transcript_17903/g.23584  ORF Transcript_17903/g.23584 Transcript_17903/m.23584 type:complete len:390 (+) Transcript_17903:341-1510(+)
MIQRKPVGRQKGRKVIPLMLSVDPKCPPTSKDNKYQNPWDPTVGEFSHTEILKISQASKKNRKSNDPKTVHSIMTQDISETKKEILDTSTLVPKIRITWIGHACILVQMNGVNILTDPIFSNHFGPSRLFSTKRYFPSPVKISDLPTIHIVLISHNHYDHLDEPTVKALGNDPTYFVPMGLKNWFSRRAITNCHEMSWWEDNTVRININDELHEIDIICTPSQHWSSRTPFDRNKTLWSSWVLVDKLSNKRIFFAGDTAYCPVFEVIGNELGPFDFAAIPVGGYEPRWFMANKHCNPEEATIIHHEIKSKQSLAISWGTFPLGEQSWFKCMSELKKAKIKYSVPASEFVGCYAGQSFILGVTQFTPFLEEEMMETIEKPLRPIQMLQKK